MAVGPNRLVSRGWLRASHRAIDKERLTASYNASKNQIYFHVRFFRAIPFLFTGLQLGIILSVTGAIVAGFIAGNEGLGYLTILANNTLETPMMFCALLLLGAIGFSFYHAMTFLKGVLMPWIKKTETITTPEGNLQACHIYIGRKCLPHL